MCSSSPVTGVVYLSSLWCLEISSVPLLDNFYVLSVVSVLVLKDALPVIFVTLGSAFFASRLLADLLILSIGEGV